MGHFRNLCFLCLLLLCGGNALMGQQPPGLVDLSVKVYGEPAPGYIFMTPAPQFPVFDEKSNLLLLDSAGEVVWYAPLADDAGPPFQTVFGTDFKPLRNGTFAYFHPGGYSRRWRILDSNMVVVDSVWCTGFYNTDAHDFDIDENGNYTVICDSLVTGDASNLTTTGGVQGSATASIDQQIVQKQDPDGNVLWNWFSLDHQPIEHTDTAYFSSPSFMDHTHMNSTWEDQGGGIVTSSRNLNEITRFDPTTGNIHWRFGGKGNDFQLIGDTEFFSSQHDANFAPNGNLYLFDNGSVGAHRIARYVEYDLDTVNRTAELVREIRHPNNLPSRYMGNADYLANGNVLVCWGGVFPVDSSVVVTEYDLNGSPVMEIDLSDDYLSYRAHKQVLDWELNRPVLTCENGTATLSAPDGHNSYWWNTGAETQEITITSPGNYQVWVDQGMGFMSSVPVTVTDVDDVCLALDEGNDVGEMLVGPNPTDGSLNIWLPKALAADWTLQVFDGLGRLVFSQNGTGTRTNLEMADWPVGVYVVRVAGAEMLFRKRVMRY